MRDEGSTDPDRKSEGRRSFLVNQREFAKSRSATVASYCSRLVGTNLGSTIVVSKVSDRK